MKMTRYTFIFISAQFTNHPCSAETIRRRRLYLEAQRRTTTTPFFLNSEAILLFGLDPESFDFHTLREHHINHIFQEMITSNHFPERVSVHRKRFAYALSQSRRQNWNVQDSLRREFVFYIFELAKKHAPVPFDQVSDEQAFQRMLKTGFIYFTQLLGEHRKNCSCSAHSSCGKSLYFLIESINFEQRINVFLM